MVPPEPPEASQRSRARARLSVLGSRNPALSGIVSLVAVHRLREVARVYGFTRFEPAPLATDDLEDVGLAVNGAPLASLV
jgi:hypothetical protein